MGINNIKILTEINYDDVAARHAQAVKEEALIIDHRHRKHPWGSMRRDCPLCQLNK